MFILIPQEFEYENFIFAEKEDFLERQRAVFFDVRVCHPNADSYRDLSPKQIYTIHENEKKRKYNSRVTEIEQGSWRRDTMAFATYLPLFLVRFAPTLKSNHNYNLSTIGDSTSEAR